MYVPNSPLKPVQTNDAAGGAGSLTQQILGVAVNGISRAADGYLSRKFPLTSFNENLTYDANGNPRPASAPQTNVSATERVSGMLSNPTVVTALGVAVVGIAIYLLVRK